MSALEHYCTPARPGYPISQYGGSVMAFGTLGCFVTDRIAPGIVYLLSNAHVLRYYEDKSWFGVDTKEMNTILCPHIGEIVQLAPAESRLQAFHGAMVIANQKVGGRMNEMIDTFRDRQPLYEVGRALQYAEYASIAEVTQVVLDSRMDAGIARLYTGVQWSNVTPDGDEIRPPVGPGYAGLRVWKWGYMSGRKKFGVIKKVVSNTTTFTQLHTSMFPNHHPKPTVSKRDVTFPAVYEVEGEDEGDFQIQGDSGSILCRADDNSVVGLMSLRESVRVALAFPIATVLDGLGVDVPLLSSGVARFGTAYKKNDLPLL